MEKTRGTGGFGSLLNDSRVYKVDGVVSLAGNVCGPLVDAAWACLLRDEDFSFA